MVCADSFSLHISLALKKPTIGLFFCTSPNEVEGYNLLRKVCSDNLSEFFPERSDIYDENLTKSISSEKVLEIVNSIKYLSTNPNN
jgi:ADP-heptose:LPS heptosyltransferase